MITKISDGQAFRVEIAERLSKGEKTNFYMSEEGYAPLIMAGSMSRLDFHNGVYFFREKEKQVDLFYFLEKGAEPFLLPDFKKPLILEEVFVAGKQQSPPEECWMAAGLEPYLKRRRMSLLSKKVEERERIPFFATESMIESILDMMKESFDPYTSALPTVAILMEDIRQKNVLVATEGEIVTGFLRFEEMKQGNTLWQIAVSQRLRGRGIAQGLVRDWLWLGKARCNKFILWVREDNLHAQRLYNNLGFLPDGRMAPVMIKQ